MSDPEDHGVALGSDAYRHLPLPIGLADTGTTHDTSVADAYGSLGAISAIPPTHIAVGPEGSGDGDGD